jgi:alanyl-tRNA synthetase
LTSALLRFARTGAFIAFTSIVVVLSQEDYQISALHLFVARSSDLEFNDGQVLREALAHLGLRGGGSAELAQGEVPAEQEKALPGSLKRRDL